MSESVSESVREGEGVIEGEGRGREGEGVIEGEGEGGRGGGRGRKGRKEMKRGKINKDTEYSKGKVQVLKGF